MIPSPSHPGCRPALLFLVGRAPIFSQKPGTCMTCWQKLRWFVKNSLFWHPLVGRGGGCAPIIGYSLGRKAIWALSCFYGSCLAFAAPMTAKCVSEASMSWRLGMLVRSERKTAAVLQTSTSLEVCEGTLVMLAVCCGRVHVLSCSGFRNSDIFSCGWIACKWGFTAFSHEDHWWIVVFHRCLDIYGKRTGSCGKKEVFMESGYEWSEDLAARPTSERTPRKDGVSALAVEKKSGAISPSTRCL